MPRNSKPILAEVLRGASVFLSEHDRDPSLARHYWLRVQDWDLTQLTRQLHEVPRQDLVENYQAALEALVQDYPLQYYLGYADFMDYRFKVTEDTLIPREETAGLIDLASNYRSRYQVAKILDIGTGSGILAIMAALKLGPAQVAGLDISVQALAVARDNGRTHQVEVKWLVSDLLEDLAESDRYDIILSNPPYISEDELELMDDSVKKYEPQLALFADQQGLAIYQALAQQLPNHVHDRSVILLEIGFQQAEIVIDIFQTAFPQAHVTSQQDFNQLDRYVIVDLQGGNESD